MVNIAICDCDSIYVSLMTKIIIEAGANLQTTNFIEYTSGDELIFDLDSGKQIDLLILDMQLGDMNGDDVAERFRKKYPYAVIIFCSGIQLPTVKSFKATPFRYLLKSYSNIEMVVEMKEILKEVERRKNYTCIVGHYRQNLIKVKVSNIMYISNTKRGSRIYVTPDSPEFEFKDPIYIDEKLIDIQEKYKKYSFEFASASYIVNMRYVKQMIPGELILHSNERLSVTRTYYRDFKDKFIKNI